VWPSSPRGPAESAHRQSFATNASSSERALDCEQLLETRARHAAAAVTREVAKRHKLGAASRCVKPAT
jgi:hypothetical protein